MKRILSKLNKLFYYFCIIYFLIFTFIIAFFYNAITTIKPRELETIKEVEASIIYDSSNRVVENLNKSKNGQVKFDELPPHLINALLSIEDQKFFYHDGLDYSSILRSFINNLTSNSRQGGSTITQQIVKNLLLSSEISYKRKIQEAYLAYKLEDFYSKEELIELYFNRIYFEATTPGIKYAAYRFFNKEVSLLNLVESALLVGLVKSPSQYSPFKYIEKADERKNLVLKCMLNEGYITNKEYETGIKTHASTFIIEKGSNYKEDTYEYQAYLDIVYEEVERLTGYSPFTKPMKIETYLDTSLQNYLDNIQMGNEIKFQDDFTQISSAVIDNKTGGIIGVIGGRNYNGMRLYNRAYHMLRQPASTLKPIFTYALAMEYLNYNEYSLIEDKPYTYPNTNITVNNADKKYLGNISVTEALGYSRNTSTLYTLEKVINKIGLNKTVDYLRSINIMDEGTFSYPYAIGGMTYGTNPINLAAAYSILQRKGNYITPSVIKSITFLDSNQEVYNHKQTQNTKVLSEETCYLITSSLKNVRNNNYLNINIAFPNDIDCVGKTGTNAYDDKVIKAYNFPHNADRDSWFAGYSKHYTIATWAGFDEPSKDKKTYFGSNDERRKYPKYLFKNIIKRLENKNQNILELPSSMIIQELVITTNKMYLPNEYVPKNKIKKVTIRKNQAIKEVLPYPTFNKVTPISLINLENEILVSLPPLEKDIYEEILGKKIYIIKYNDIDKNEYIQLFDSEEFIIPIYSNYYEISICESYKNSTSLKGDAYIHSTLT